MGEWAQPGTQFHKEGFWEWTSYLRLSFSVPEPFLVTYPIPQQIPEYLRQTTDFEEIIELQSTIGC